MLLRCNIVKYTYNYLCGEKIYNNYLWQGMTKGMLLEGRGEFLRFGHKESVISKFIVRNGEHRPY